MKIQSLIILIVVSAFLHFWRLDVPREVVFDEVHYGKFINAYCCTHQRIFDVHPPFPKILMAMTSKVFGLSGKFSFEKIGLPLGDEPVFWLRFWPALTGTFLPLLIYLTLMALQVSQTSAFFLSLCLCFENATLVQTRFMLLDGFLLLGVLGCLWCFIELRRAILSTHARQFSIGYVVGAAIFAAIACQTKFTGIVTLLLPLSLWGISLKQWGTILSIFLPLVFAGYYVPWMLHFKLLTLPGFGDAFYKVTNDFFTDFVRLHQEMVRASTNIATPHPDASPWWSWPIMKTPPFFWTTPSRYIYLIGNPVLWWGSFVGLLAIVGHALFSLLRKTRTFDCRLWWLLLLYLAGFAPLAPFKRPLFLYLYFPSLWILIMTLAVWLETIGVLPKYRVLLLGATLIGFLVVSPLTYGFPVSHGYLRFLYFRPEFFLR